MLKKIYQVLKVSLKSNFFFLLIFFNSSFASDIPNLLKENDFALITNQESNMLDIIDLELLEKVNEIKLGNSPVGIVIDQEKKIAYVTNPGDNNITEINFLQKTKEFIPAGKNPLGIALSNDKNHIFVTNWYDDKISVIEVKSKKIIKEIKVGKNPAGLLVHSESGDLIVCNRGNNNIMFIDGNKYNIKKTIDVEKSPFGVFFDNTERKLFVTNVQSNSISIINYDKLVLIKNIKVGKWPYHVAFDELNNKVLISNQRENSITIINSNNYEVYKIIHEICEYPEGIDIDNNNKIAIVACWFSDEVVIIDLLDYTIRKRISASGGPRGFGKFILKN